MNFVYTESFMKENPGYARANMMGPNSIRVSEELCTHIELKDGMRVLDLGCGAGLSSLLLREKFGCQVFAADLWIDPTENMRRFAAMGAGDIIPISLDATKQIPFAHDYFDVIFSVDSYHYYGYDEDMLPKLLPFLKDGGSIAVAVPGIKRMLDEIPHEMQPFWQDDMNFCSVEWWLQLWRQSEAKSIEGGELACHAQAWQEWLACDNNEHAVGDRAMMAAEAGKYFNHVWLTAKR